MSARPEEGSPVASARSAAMLLAREAGLRKMPQGDADAVRRAAAELAPELERACVREPEHAGLAAAWLRTLRRAVAPWGAVALALEATEVRLGRQPRVASAALFLRLDRCKALAEQGQVEAAGRMVAKALPGLLAADEPRYGAMSLLAVLRRIVIGVERLDPMERAEVLDPVIEAVAPHAEALVRAWPARAEGAREGEEEGRAMAPRLRGLLVLRRLGMWGQRWGWLVEVLGRARQAGVQCEWLADTEVQALQELGRMEEALELAARLRPAWPRSEVLGRRHGALLRQVGREEEARVRLREVALSSSAPWSFRDLAALCRGRGEVAEAIACLRAGLARQDVREPGLVWGLHRELAELLLENGDEPAAARELWLGCEARQQAGWGLGPLGAMVAACEARVASVLAECDAAPPGQVRHRALLGYRRALEDWCMSQSEAGTVTEVREGHAFVATDGGTQVYVPAWLLRRAPLAAGSTVRVVVVEGVARNGRILPRAAWLQAASRQAGPATGSAVNGVA